MQTEIIPSHTFTLSEPAPLFKPFGDRAGYVRAGDTREVQSGPFTIRATIKQDDSTRPTDFDCYAPEHIAAWERGEWSYVGVVLSVHLDDLTLDEHATSLWGIDCNLDGENTYLADVANDLLPEAIERAEHLRATLAAKLT